MPPRTKTTKETPVTTSFDFTAVQAAPASQPVNHFKENPLKRLVQESIDEGYAPKEITVPEAVADDAVNMLRRAALPVDKGGLEVGLRLLKGKTVNGNVTITYQAKAEKKNRNYTADDVRKWAESQNCPKEDIYPRVKREVSRAYRVAHGYPVQDSK